MTHTCIQYSDQDITVVPTRGKAHEAAHTDRTPHYGLCKALYKSNPIIFSFSLFDINNYKDKIDELEWHKTYNHKYYHIHTFSHLPILPNIHNASQLFLIWTTAFENGCSESQKL